MSKSEHDPSIENEPQFGSGPARPDPSEQTADAVGGKRPSDDLDRHSVFDEPDIFPGRAAELIDQDWSCSQCGYNLRGLNTGHRCPECGHFELYRPPPTGASSFGEWYTSRRQLVTVRRSWLVVVGMALCGGPFAIIGALMASTPSALMVIVFGPTVEEVMKLAAIAFVVETRPYLIRKASQIWFAALAGALGFAVIENIVYLTVYIPSPSTVLVYWRWIICTGLHVGCTAVAVGGLAKVWLRVDTEHRAPKLAEAMPPLFIAIILHGSYNAFVTFLHYADYGF